MMIVPSWPSLSLLHLLVTSTASRAVAPQATNLNIDTCSNRFHQAVLPSIVSEIYEVFVNIFCLLHIQEVEGVLDDGLHQPNQEQDGH